MARKVAFLVGATMLSSMLYGVELMSERTFVFLRPETSSFWHTATNSTLTLPIYYPIGATRAALTVSGVKYSYSTNLPANTAEFDLELPAPTSPQSENVYDLTLAFDNGASRTALYRGGNTTRNYTFSHVACRREWNDLNARYGVCGFRLWMYAD